MQNLGEEFRLTRLARDVGLGEDLAQEAILAALEQWSRTGVPENPGAWLTATTRRRAIVLSAATPSPSVKHRFAAE